MPDYQSAKQMAQVARQRQKHWVGSNKYYRDEEFDHSQGKAGRAVVATLYCCKIHRYQVSPAASLVI